MKKLFAPVSVSMKWLRTPILGLARRIHETVMRIPGMMMRARVNILTTFASGVSVRCTTQARKVPRAKEKDAEANAKRAVFQVAVQKSLLPNARA